MTWHGVSAVLMLVLNLLQDPLLCQTVKPDSYSGLCSLSHTSAGYEHPPLSTALPGQVQDTRKEPAESWGVYLVQPLSLRLPCSFTGWCRSLNADFVKRCVSPITTIFVEKVGGSCSAELQKWAEAAEMGWAASLQLPATAGSSPGKKNRAEVALLSHRSDRRNLASLPMH